MRRSRLVLVVFLIGIVLTSGCLGLGGGDSTSGDDETTSPTGEDDTAAPDDDESADSNGDDTSTESDENGDDTRTDDSSDEPTDEESPSDPTDETDSGVDDWAVTDPEGPLHDAGSYTNTWTWRSSFEEADSAGEMTATTLVDLEAARASSTMEVTGDGDSSVTEVFYADGQQYTRFGSLDGDDDVYFATDAEFDESGLFLDYGSVYDSADLSEWTAEGTETYDGVSVQRYTYVGTDYWTELDEEIDDEGTFSVESVTYEMLVDADGIPRYQSNRIDAVDETGTEGTYEWEYAVTDVGTTSVADPPWLDAAISGAY